MSPDAEAALEEATRCFLALPSPAGPLVRPFRCWYDGRHLWMTTAAAALDPVDLSREVTCSAWVPGTGQIGLHVTGSARAFGADAPLPLLLHAPAIAGALTALAASNADAIPGYLQEGARLPGLLAPLNRVVLRLRPLDAANMEPPPAVRGVAPALPPVVPAEVRRVLSGQRTVVVGVEAPRLAAVPAQWGAGFSLATSPAQPLPAGARVEVVVDPVDSAPGAGSLGLAVRGRISTAGALQADEVTWWDGAEVSRADVPRSTATSGIVLPD